MQKIKSKFLKLINNECFPFIFLAVLLLFFHACINVGHGDDKFFSCVLIDKNMFDWLVSRYNSWSSRVVIEFFLALIAGNHVLWRFLDTAIMVLGAFSISRVISFKKSVDLNWTICALILCLPVSLYPSAGWIATTLNYSWVAFLGLFSMIPIKKVISYENIKWYEYCFYFIAMIYAGNQEQMCLILLSVYFVFTCYVFCRDRKLNWFLTAGTLLNLLSIFFILICPGNANRKNMEVKNWFPEYNNINIFRKIEMGFSSTLFEFIMKPNCIFFIFSLLLFFCVYLKCKNTCYSFIAIVPLACSFIFGFLVNVIGEEFPNLVYIKNSMTPYGTGLRLEPRTWIPDIILVCVCLSVVISLYILFENKKIFLLTVFILLLGFGSRMVLAFSPTIWASGPRTFIFMYLSIVICSAILYQKLKLEKNKIDIKIFNYIIFVLGMMSFANMVYFML